MGEFIYLAIGFVILLVGGHMVVSGASGIALALGIPRLIVGMTVVAFGTSAPELAVSLSGAFKGSPGITFGNVVGSNIANIGLLLGITSLIRPLEVESKIITREIPMMILSCFALLILSLDSWHQASEDIVTKGDGCILLLLFAVFLYYTAMDLKEESQTDSFAEEAQQEVFWRTFKKMGVLVTLLVIGIGGLVYGGNLLVTAASTIARDAGVPEVVIGASIVAFGTSLPELVTCLFAAYKNMPDLVVGNIVGSNLFNVLLIMGTTSTVMPIPLPAGSELDLWAMAFLSCLLLILTITDKRVIIRTEGAGLLLIYTWYIIWLSGR